MFPTRGGDGPLIPALETPSFAQPATPKTDVLTGPLGLRAGWGILLFIVLSGMLAFVLFVGLFKGTGHWAALQGEAQQTQKAARDAKAAHQPFNPPPTKLSTALLSEAAEGGAVLLAALGVSFFEQRRFRVYGLGQKHLRDLLPGAAWGLLLISGLVALLRGLHLLVFDTRLLSGAALVRFGTLWLLGFLLVGIFEEFLFRGYIQFTLTRGLLGLGKLVSPTHAQRAAFWITAVLLSLGFSASHLINAGEDGMGVLMVFAAGILFSYALWRTGSLWWGVGFHMTWDWGQSFLFGVPDSGTLSAGRLFATHAVGKPLLSGGMVGPEGSVYVLPALLLAALAIRLQPQRAQPPLEPEWLPSVPQPTRSEAVP